MNPYTEVLYQNYARLGKALSSPARIALLELLIQSPYAVEKLSELSGLSVANTSQHLQHLRQAGLVRSHRKGLQIIYELASLRVQETLAAFGSLAHSQLAEIREMEVDFLTHTEHWQSLDFADLTTHLEAGALLVDVRPAAEYEAGHLPNAISIPLADLEQRLQELPQNLEIIAYCRGPYCLFAVQAAQILEKAGFKTGHFRPGWSQWQQHKVKRG